MRCSCDLARREAREETLREVASWHKREASECGLRDDDFGDYLHRRCYDHFRAILTAQESARNAIVDCVEVDATSAWPAMDSGVDGA